MNDFFEKLGAAAHKFIDLSKAVSIAGATLGFVYFLAYTLSNGVPFPLEFGTLITILFFIGATSLLFISILTLSVQLPAILTNDKSSLYKKYLLGEDYSSNNLKSVKESIIRYFSAYWPPLALAICGEINAINNFENGIDCISIALFALSLAWMVITPFRTKIPDAKKLQFILNTAFHVLVALFSYTYLIFILAAISPEIRKWSTIEASLLALLIFTFIHILTTVPVKQIPNKILRPPNFEHKITSSLSMATYILGMVVLCTVLFTPSKMGEIALSLFKMGGNFPMQICLKDSPSTELTKNVHFHENCSEPISVVLDSGDKIYIRKFPTNNEKETGNLIYISQKNVKEKIYIKRSLIENSEKTTHNGESPK